MKWYTYRQNNSGGHFYGYRYVIVQAESAEKADLIAQCHDVYFDGCEKGIDCSCCGDRWYHQWEEGTDKPSIYGDEIDPNDIRWDNGWGDILDDKNIKVVPNPDA
jgi:hypothetical protein